ncbi:lipocalin-like domain-containing protein [Elongatibacter sediminis]|uniref:Lipocalin-like domain-containing protein n=1 Tax=Elongatibacter sediminis TaxID=3119006 RepID=A0AAW9R968_9GAMM
MKGWLPQHGRAMVLLAGLAAAPFLTGCSNPDDPPPRDDFAVLARAEPGYRQARPGRSLHFPADHGAHPDYRIEWWYLTANLRDDAGRAWGLQWTLFRTATAPPSARDTSPPANAWQSPQIYMAHFAISTPDGHREAQRYARGGLHDGLARAGANAWPFRAWLDDWTLASTTGDWLPLRLSATAHPDGARLELDSDRGLVLQGQNGFSRKHAGGGGSHYYSHPFLQARGELTVDGRTIAVHGDAWLDREWSSQFLQTDQAGWDWFAVHLESGEKLMLFRVRPRDPTSGSPHVHGVLIQADGSTRPLEPDLIEFRVLTRTPVAGHELPLHWRIRIPEIERVFEVRALYPDQWMDVDFAYWEGVVTVSGSGPQNSGTGYLELTGYPRQ